MKISETMRMGRDDTEAVWDPELDAIVIKRARLGSLAEYAATLLHEVAHAMTGTHDASREFENVLTDYLGRPRTRHYLSEEAISCGTCGAARARRARSAGRN